MNASNGSPAQAPPTPDEIANLQRLTAGIIRAQGNRFIKELLRAKNLPIGSTKGDFESNLNAAIESGALRLSDVDDWLKLVEGWGNQHVYLYNVTPALAKGLTEPVVRQRAHTARLDGIWGATTALQFPDAPSLTSISFSDSVLSLVWQESSLGWIPVPEKNFQKQEELDLFEYRAYRAIEQRAITRFEVHLDRKLAALFIPDPVQNVEHQQAVDEARRVIALLMDIDALDKGQVDVSAVSKNLDQQTVPSNAGAASDVRTQKSRLGSGGAYVEFAANDPTKAYWQEPAVEDVRKSVRTDQLAKFDGTGGVFIFTGAGSPARDLRVQLYAADERIRLWAQMDANEVWETLSRLSTCQ
jgi:hypothetical protein